MNDSKENDFPTSRQYWQPVHATIPNSEPISESTLRDAFRISLVLFDRQHATVVGTHHEGFEVRFRQLDRPWQGVGQPGEARLQACMFPTQYPRTLNSSDTTTATQTQSGSHQPGAR